MYVCTTTSSTNSRVSPASGCFCSHLSGESAFAACLATVVEAASKAALAAHPPVSVSPNAVSVALSAVSAGVSSVGIRDVPSLQSNLSSNAAVLMEAGVGFLSSQAAAPSQALQGRPTYVAPSFVSTFSAPIPSLV